MGITLSFSPGNVWYENLWGSESENKAISKFGWSETFKSIPTKESLGICKNQARTKHIDCVHVI